jgi:hypothetical protein
VLDIEDLVPSQDERLLEAIDFLGQKGLSQFKLGNGRSRAPKHEDFAPADARRNRYAPESLLSRVLPFCHGWFLFNALSVGKQ